MDSLTKTGCPQHFPKIFTLGQKYIGSIFDEPVEVTEKVDGSQFGFGKWNGTLYVRSKGQVLNEHNVPGMFEAGWNYVHSIADRLPDQTFFYGEFLNKPKHNNLVYDSIPLNGIALFGVLHGEDDFAPYPVIKEWASELNVDVVPKLYEGKVAMAEDLLELLNHDSFLGGPKIEGFVVKNYKEMWVGGTVQPIMAGKYVSDAYKEKARGWSKAHTGKGKWEEYRDSFITEARWQKAVQHLREIDVLDDSPKDIGPLIKEVVRDIEEECKADIMEALWGFFGKDVLRLATRGFPEWYKRTLLEQSFEEE